MGSTFSKRYPVYLALYLLWLLVFYTLTSGGDADNWLLSLRRWDSNWYMTIMESGYTLHDHKALAFPPGYPWLLLALSRILPFEPWVIASIVNVPAYFFALVMAVELLSRILHIRSRYAFFTLLLSTPTAYFAFSVYTDMVFMCMFWGVLTLALLHPKSKASLIAQAALLLVMPWIRIAGYSLFSWLLLKRWVALVLIIPATAWLGFNYYIAGDPIFFIKAQSLFLMPEGGAWTGVNRAFTQIINIPSSSNPQEWRHYIQTSFLPVFYLLTLTASAIWFWIRGEKQIALTILSVLAISHYAPIWRSVVRYDMPLLPFLFAPLLVMAERRTGNLQISALVMGALGGIQFASQIFFTCMFRNDIWGF